MTKPETTSPEGKKVGTTKLFTESGESLMIPVVEVTLPTTKKEKSETPWYVKHMNGRW
ncbi:hypothetical protein QX249_10385 [Vibrio parahaemolyticus]|uniref:Uncharacterized protein n=1 Tax=Vibrio parahaemolyticus TaxID=670 RepID=A0AAW8PXW1_VIBPH|nr:hypothetical protein [Vibrio parahaemolyticus]MDS1821067.1 hypothetical protein [Vibrio parahaemolyticus]